MYGAWEDAISCDGVNDTFFIESEGVTQRELLFKYLPYMCAVHNRDFDMLSLLPGSEFRKLSLAMLNYRGYSIIGFSAYLGMTIALDDDTDAARDFVLELTREGTPAGRFVAVNIIENFSLIHPEFSEKALAIVADDMIPYLLNDNRALGHLIVCAAGIAEGDIESNWAHLRPSLERSFAHLTDHARPDEIIAFCRELRSLTFFTDIRIGTLFIEYLIEAGYLHRGSIWRDGALEICAGLHARRRKELSMIFEKHGIAQSVLREAEVLKTQQMSDQQRTFGARARWNLFFLRAFAFNTKLRYQLVKYMLGPIALCNEVPEWAVLMGRFMIQISRVYLSEEEVVQGYERLSVEDIYTATEFRPRPGGGKLYKSRRTQSKERGP